MNVFGFGFDPNIDHQILARLWIGDVPVWYNSSVWIRNLGDNMLHNLSVTTSTRINGLHVRVTPETVERIEPLATVPLAIEVGASDLALDDGTVKSIEIVYGSAEAVEQMLHVHLAPKAPFPSLLAPQLTAKVLRGVRTARSVTIRNKGKRASGNQTYIELPSGLPWLSLVSPADLGSLAPGESETVSIAMHPPADGLIGDYRGSFVVHYDDGARSLAVPFRFTVVSDSKASIRFLIEDEYTYNTQEKPKVNGATVMLLSVYGGVSMELPAH